MCVWWQQERGQDVETVSVTQAILPSVVGSQLGCGEMTDWNTGKNDTAPRRELLTPREIVVVGKKDKAEQ